MPEMNPGYPRGTVLPIYLAIRDIGGTLVAQPEGSPTIEIVYVDSELHRRVNSVDPIVMTEVEPGMYYYLWHIDEDEQLGIHDLLLRGVIDDTPLIASDLSFEDTLAVQNPTFVVKLNVTKKLDIVYPNTLPLYPHRTRQSACTGAHSGRDREVDIGLDDRVLEGAFRFGEFPDQVVDRRVMGSFQVRLIDPRARFGSTTPSSEMPGGGPAVRPQAPPTRNMRYREGYRYKK